MNKHDEVLGYLQRAIKNKEQMSSDIIIEKSFIVALHEVGRCLVDMNNHDTAVKYFQRANLLHVNPISLFLKKFGKNVFLHVKPFAC